MKHSGIDRRRALTAGVAGLILLPLAAAGGLRFTERTELPTIGLQVRLMAGSMPLPVPPARTWHYTVRRGDESWQEEQYDPAELWRHSQIVGRWGTTDGLTLLLAAVTTPRPRGFEREHATRETYRTVAARPRNAAAADWDSDALAAWVADFAALDTPTLTTVRRPTIQTRHLLRVESPTAPDNRLTYCVMPAWRPTRVRDGAAPWIYIQLDLPAGSDPGAARRTLKSGLVASLAPVSMAATPRPARDAPAAPADERAQSRQAAIASIANLRGWWHDSTEHYVILTDASPRHRILVNELKANLEQLRTLYARMVPPLAPVRTVSVIRIFENGNDYLRYVGPENAWTGGLWMPSRQELVIRPSSHGATRDQRRHALAVAYHEGFHQHAFYALGRQVIPPWFDEGHAELFETAQIRGSTVTLPENPDAATLVERILANGAPPIPALLAMDHATFYARDEAQRRANYALAWALVYYLRKGAAAERPARYHTICDRFIQALTDGADGPAATRQAFEPVNMARFIEQFTDFWTSRHRRAAAARIRYEL